MGLFDSILFVILSIPAFAIQATRLASASTILQWCGQSGLVLSQTFPAFSAITAKTFRCNHECKYL